MLYITRSTSRTDCTHCTTHRFIHYLLRTFKNVHNSYVYVILPHNSLKCSLLHLWVLLAQNIHKCAQHLHTCNLIIHTNVHNHVHLCITFLEHSQMFTKLCILASSLSLSSQNIHKCSQSFIYALPSQNIHKCSQIEHLCTI